jgi:hypothetical protein
MGRLRLFDRVKSWFGAKVETQDGTAGPSAKRWSIETAEPGARLGFTGAGTAAVATRGPSLNAAADDADYEYPAPAAPSTEAIAASLATLTTTRDDTPPPAAASAAAEGDPLDPAWMASLDELPRRIAEAATQGTAGLHALKAISLELEGHRQNTRALLQTIRRLPFLEAEQTEVARDANKLLERQLLILESMFDGITSLRASFRSVDESSKRQILAISQLETCHRNVLIEYQTLLIRAHRRVAWIAAIGVLLGATALGGAAYVAWRVLVP